MTRDVNCDYAGFQCLVRAIYITWNPERISFHLCTNCVKHVEQSNQQWRELHGLDNVYIIELIS